VEIFVPKPRLQKKPKIWAPEEVGAWEDSRGRWHYTLTNEPLISISKPLPVKCHRCGKPHVFRKSGKLGGWKPPMAEAKRPGWLCPSC
jgi:hypothetical protein